MSQMTLTPGGSGNLCPKGFGDQSLPHLDLCLKFLFLQSKLKPQFSYVISLICQACSCLTAFLHVSQIPFHLLSSFRSSGHSPSYLIKETSWQIPSVRAPSTHSSLLTDTFNMLYLQSSYHKLILIKIYVSLPVDPCLLWSPPRKCKLQMAKIFWFLDCFYLQHWQTAM